MTELHWNPVVDGAIRNEALTGPVRLGKTIVMRERWDSNRPNSFTMELERTPWHRMTDVISMRHRDVQTFRAHELAEQENTSVSDPLKVGTADRSNLARWTFVDDTPERNRSAPLAVTSMNVSLRTSGINLQEVGGGVPGASAQVKGNIGAMEFQYSIYATDEDPAFRVVILFPGGEDEHSLWSFIEYYLRGEEGLQDMSLESMQEALSGFLPREAPRGWSVSFLGSPGEQEVAITVNPGEVRTLAVQIEIGERGGFGYALKLVDADDRNTFIVGDLMRVQNSEQGVSLTI